MLATWLSRDFEANLQERWKNLLKLAKKPKGSGFRLPKELEIWGHIPYPTMSPNRCMDPHPTRYMDRQPFRGFDSGIGGVPQGARWFEVLAIGVLGAARFVLNVLRFLHIGGSKRFTVYLDLQNGQNNGPYTAYTLCFGILGINLGSFWRSRYTIESEGFVLDLLGVLHSALGPRVFLIRGFSRRFRLQGVSAGERNHQFSMGQVCTKTCCHPIVSVG